MTDTVPTLSCVTEFIVDCLHKTAPTQEIGFPLIRTPNIGKGRFNLDGVHRISQEIYDKWTIRAVPQKNDLIMAREAPAGNVAIIKSDEPHCLGQRTVHIRPNPELINPDFLTYFLLAPKQQAALLRNQIGVHVGHVNMKDIRKLPLEDLPPIEEQKKLAQIIAEYDDLIENNLRRIQLLEQSARLLYKEWFVHLRFPGHEHVKIKDGVPEGWERKELGKICALRAGISFKLKYQGQAIGDIPFIKVRDMNSSGNTIVITEANNWITSDECVELRGKPFPRGTVVFAKIGEAIKKNRVRFLNRDTLIDNNMMGAIPNQIEIDPSFLYFLLSRYDFSAIAGGAAVPFLSGNVLKQEIFLVPGKLIRRLFNEAVSPILEQITFLQIQGTKAAQARDFLLPRLMNGEIAV